MTMLQNVWYWKLAILRCFIYGGMVAWGVYKAGVEGYTTLKDIPDLSWWKLIGDCLMAFAGVILAFLDSTIARLNEGKPDAEVAQAVKNIDDAQQAASIKQIKTMPVDPAQPKKET